MTNLEMHAIGNWAGYLGSGTSCDCAGYLGSRTAGSPDIQAIGRWGGYPQVLLATNNPDIQAIGSWAKYPQVLWRRAILAHRLLAFG